MPGLAVYRFGASLYYANAEPFAAEVRGLLKDTREPIRWFCLVAETLDDLDYSGSAVLKIVIEELQKKGRITFALCDLSRSSWTSSSATTCSR